MNSYLVIILVASLCYNVLFYLEYRLAKKRLDRYTKMYDKIYQGYSKISMEYFIIKAKEAYESEDYIKLKHFITILKNDFNLEYNPANE